MTQPAVYRRATVEVPDVAVTLRTQARQDPVGRRDPETLPAVHRQSTAELPGEAARAMSWHNPGSRAVAAQTRPMSWGNRDRDR